MPHTLRLIDRLPVPIRHAQQMNTGVPSLNGAEILIEVLAKTSIMAYGKRAFQRSQNGGSKLPEFNHLITIISDYKRITLDTRTIHYVFVNHNIAEFHLSTEEQYKARLPIKKLETMLGDEFIRIHRNYLVAVRAIHNITDKIYLNNGETLHFAQRRKGELIVELRQRRQMILDRFNAESTIHTESEYHAHFQSFDDLPIAFADIEMVLDEKQSSVDWVFRYGNDALARLEQTALCNLIGSTFSSIFPNMDVKWLKIYERSAFYDQTVEIIDYSPEIDTDLDIICFPTMKGHCGCILMNIGEMRYAETPSDRKNARLRYLAKFLSRI